MTPRILNHFRYEHLKPELQAVSKPFGDLARMIAEQLPDNEQRALALQCLLQSKDAAVRAVLEGTPEPRIVEIDPNALFTGKTLKDLAERLLEYQRDGGEIRLGGVG